MSASISQLEVDSDFFNGLLGTCPLVVPSPVTLSVDADTKKNGKVTVDRAQGPKTAGRCTLMLTAAFEGTPGQDLEITNNTAHVAIDIEQ